MRLGLMMVGTLLFLCAGSASAGSQEVTGPQLTMTPPGNPECRDYTVQAAIEGKPATVVGHACQAPDGRWQVVQAVPPSQPIVPPVLAYPPPPPAVFYPYGAWVVGPPVAFSAGTFAFVGRRPFPRFRAFPGFHRFPHFVPRFHAVAPHRFGGFGARGFGMSGRH